MRIEKAVITAAGRSQRAMPLQTLIDRDGQVKPVLTILAEEVVRAGIEDICVVVWPGDETRYAEAMGPQTVRVRFVPQPQPLGYGQAIYCAREFAAGEPVLHLVGDHLYVAPDGAGSAGTMLRLAQEEACSVSTVQPTREDLLPNFGVVGGRRITGKPGVYRVDTVIEKPTPTEAEQRLLMPGLRNGYYLGFFGMHVLTPAVMEILGRQLAAAEDPRQVTLSSALAELARQEQYLAVESAGRRYDIGARYGLMLAQMALGLSGNDREEVLFKMLELLALRAAQ